jgi:hypothetical protein
LWLLILRPDFSADFGFRPVCAHFYSAQPAQIFRKSHEKADENARRIVDDFSYEKYA